MSRSGQTNKRAAVLYDIVQQQAPKWPAPGRGGSKLPVSLARFREESAVHHWSRARVRTRIPVVLWSSRCAHAPMRPSSSLTPRFVLLIDFDFEARGTFAALYSLFAAEPFGDARPWPAVVCSFPTAHDGSLQLCDVARPDRAIGACEDVRSCAAFADVS